MEPAQPTTVASCADFRLNEWLIQPSLGRVSGAQGTIHLRPLLMELLLLLARNSGRVISKEEINRAIWGRRFLAESALSRLLAELRRVLGDDVESPRFIETVPKRGYRLIAPVCDEIRAAEAPAARRSVAVLPFTDMAREKDQEYLCDGLAEELTNALTRIRRLRVIARTSAFSFKGKAVDVREIGRQLGVDAIVEGGIQRSGGRLRVTVQLVSAADGGHLWSEHFDRAPGDIFAIEDEIAQAVASGLKINLLGDEVARLFRRHSPDPQAHDLYLWGRHLWGKRTPDAVAKAIECFHQAIERDAGYALAHAALSECYGTSGFLGFLAPQKAYPSAKTAARKAVDLDPALADAHAVLGFASATYDWEWFEAERCFRRAEELGPSAQARVWHAMVLAALARFEDAQAEIETAWDLDPLSPLVQATVGCILMEARRYEAAIERCRKTLEMDPGYVLGNFHLGRTYLAMGRFEEALAPLEKAAHGFPMAMGMLGAAWAKVGRPDKAGEILHELERLSGERYVGPLAFAMVHGGLGSVDTALEWYSRAFEAREGIVALLGVDPNVDWLRPDPRFQALLQRLRLPPA